MRILSLYFGQFLGLRIFAVLFALTALLLLKDVIENVEDVLDRRGSALDILDFVWYRLPTVAESIIPVAVLIGSVLGMRALSMRSELVALWSAGVSHTKLFAFCLPLCCLVAASHYFIAGQVVPQYENALSNWWKPQNTAHKNLWLNDEENFVRIERVLLKGTRLEGVTIVRNDGNSEGVDKIMAASAKYDNQGWLLEDVETIVGGLKTAKTEKKAELRWPEGPSPEILVTLVSEPAHLTSRELRAIVSERWTSSLAYTVYKTELARRSVVPFSSVLMLFLAVVTVRGQNRGSGPQKSAAISIAAGLSFVIVDGFFKAMGRTGLLAAELAAWLPLLLFFGAAGIVLLRHER